MGYEDRDYFQSKPKFELSAGLRPATKGLVIAVIAAYVMALVAGNATSFVSDAFAASTAGGAPWVKRLVVLTPLDINTWLAGYSPGYWKLLTHWLVPVDILGVVLGGLSVFFAGRMVEEVFGTRRFLLLFISACVLSGLLACLVDPLLLRGRTSVVMGPSAGAFAMFTSVAWIAPHQRSLFGWKLRPVVLVLVSAFALISVVSGALGSAPRVQSPTQLVWGVLAAVVYMSILQARGRVPVPATGSYAEPWNRRGNLPEDVDDVSRALAEARKQEERERAAQDKARAAQAADQQKLDAILDKISRQGISSLSRGEKAFLDEQARRRKS